MRSSWAICLAALVGIASLPGQAQHARRVHSYRRVGYYGARHGVAPRTHRAAVAKSSDWRARWVQQHAQRHETVAAKPADAGVIASHVAAAALAESAFDRSAAKGRGPSEAATTGTPALGPVSPGTDVREVTGGGDIAIPGANSSQFFVQAPPHAALNEKPAVAFTSSVPTKAQPGVDSTRKAEIHVARTSKSPTHASVVTAPAKSPLLPLKPAPAPAGRTLTVSTAKPGVIPLTAAPRPVPATAAGTKVEVGASQAKPDLFSSGDPAKADHPLESPLQAVGDGWKMIAYLLPTLCFILVCLNLLKRYQQKNGKLPGVVQTAHNPGRRPSNSSPWTGLVRSLQSARGRETKASSIRLIESVPVGAANLHLVQVHGKLLLLGASGTGVTVLTEFEEETGVQSDEFRAMLQAAASDLDSLDIPEAEMPASAVVGSLDYVMRDTGEALARRVRRLRTVQEAEESVSEGRS